MEIPRPHPPPTRTHAHPLARTCVHYRRWWWRQWRRWRRLRTRYRRRSRGAIGGLCTSRLCVRARACLFRVLCLRISVHPCVRVRVRVFVHTCAPPLRAFLFSRHGVRGQPLGSAAHAAGAREAGYARGKDLLAQLRGMRIPQAGDFSGMLNTVFHQPPPAPRVSASAVAAGGEGEPADEGKHDVGGGGVAPAVAAVPAVPAVPATAAAAGPPPGFSAAAAARPPPGFAAAAARVSSVSAVAAAASPVVEYVSIGGVEGTRMPRPLVRVAGEGPGATTTFVNMAAVAAALRRDPELAAMVRRRAHARIAATPRNARMTPRARARST